MYPLKLIGSKLVNEEVNLEEIEKIFFYMLP